MDVKRVEQQIGSKTVSLETGKLAKAADGAVVISCGETRMLVTAVAAGIREHLDFFPLTVDIEERMYAVGRIPGSFFRREGRPTEVATLTARLTDRPLRPSFPDWFRHETQVVATILQVDEEDPWDAHCITGASAALMLGGIPFAGPISGVRMAHIRGQWVPFPTFQELENATIELVVAGRDSGDDVDILMIEAGGFEQTHRLITEEGAPKPTEEVLAGGLDEAKEVIRQLCAAQEALAAQCEIPSDREWVRKVEYEEDVMERVRAIAESRLADALAVSGKFERKAALKAISNDLHEQLDADFEGREKEISNAFDALQKAFVRARTVNEGVRIDGRGPKELRPLYTEAGLLNRAHGTGLFQRGETQVLSIATLAMPRMEQMLDTISPEESKRYMHHYNSPPFSFGDAFPMRGPRRRDIGHGALAEKAVLPVMPGEDEFPYAIRVVSEVLESNGSTSMASTCASSMALADAGVPLKAMVGGIAMGLIIDGDRHVTLTDIVGAEDGFGDMDFKVAGTEEFVTALQLDTKTTGIPARVLGDALQQAKEARLEILAAMRQAIDGPRADLSPYAPRIIIEQIPVDKIGEIIGPKGKTINEIVDTTGASIDVEDDGRILIGATDGETADRALKMIRSIVSPPPLEIGQEFEGTVVKTTDFGAFVNLTPGRDGLVHISKLGGDKRIDKVEDVVTVGDKMWVKVNEIRADGKLNLLPIDEPSGDGGGVPEEAESTAT